MMMMMMMIAAAAEICQEWGISWSAK